MKPPPSALSMRPDHRAVVLAQLAVVRRAASLLAEHGVLASAPVDAAIRLVERWATEGGVDGEALAAASRAAWEAGAPHRLASEPHLRAQMWLATGAGNVSTMARKERGWKDTPRTILDAAANALSSLRVPGLPKRTELEQLAADTLAAIEPAPRRKKAPGPPRPKKLGATPELGELANAYLTRRKPMRDPRLTADRATLAALLSARGLPTSEAVLTFEERYGGTRFADVGRGEGADFVLGPYALSKDDATGNEERGLVPIALSPNDVWYFLDEAGAGWVQDAIEDPEPVPFATTAVIALARLVLYLRAFHDRHAHGGVDLDGHRGATLARELRLPAIAEASDTHARFWGDPRTLVIEHEVEGEPTTTVIGRVAEKLTT
jgi:hypothetical protein